jgi:hypothetical protein
LTGEQDDSINTKCCWLHRFDCACERSCSTCITKPSPIYVPWRVGNGCHVLQESHALRPAGGVACPGTVSGLQAVAPLAWRAVVAAQAFEEAGPVLIGGGAELARGVERLAVGLLVVVVAVVGFEVLVKEALGVVAGRAVRALCAAGVARTVLDFGGAQGKVGALAGQVHAVDSAEVVVALAVLGSRTAGAVHADLCGGAVEGRVREYEHEQEGAWCGDPAGRSALGVHGWGGHGWL